MTTIVYKKPGILACDKQTSFSGLKFRGASKLQYGKKHAYAICGCLGAGLAAVKWIEGGCKGDSPLEDDETIVVSMDLKTGKAMSWEPPGIAIPLEDELYAIGSGGHIAIGALAMGATPEEAVRIAGEWDEGTGFGVQVVYSERAKRWLERQQEKGDLGMPRSEHGRDA